MSIGLSTKFAVVLAVGAALLVLPACAGHKELKAPCSASLVPSSIWSSAAFADSGCGPMLELNALPTPEQTSAQEQVR